MPTLYWSGNSGNSYGFHIYPVGTEFIPSPAVYMLCHEFLHGGVLKYGALYVGEGARSPLD